MTPLLAPATLPRLWRRLGPLSVMALLAASLAIGPIAAIAAPPSPSSAQDAATDPSWVVNFESAPAYGEPDAAAEQLGTIRQFTYLQVVAYEGDWALVLNPRTGETAYVESRLLGASGTPPEYVVAPAPPAEERIGEAGRLLQGTALSYVPAEDEWVVTRRLGANAQVFVADAVRGADGALWYRTDGGEYLPAAAVSFTPVPEPVVAAPAAPVARALPRTFGGRWIDVNLNTPSTFTAYDGNVAVRSGLVIRGRDRTTPPGVFSIQRRVYNETMDSSTIGIPRNGPGGYYLTGVLFTQYFLGTGQAFHYNYWSSMFGYEGSHGCLGMTYADSEWLWNWAGIGTPVSIHY